MARNQRNTVIQYLGNTVLLQDGAGLTDGQLLGRFVEHRDDAAFAALVKRHGPMVWGVCYRVLGKHHDAEDAFQAAFLVLFRKAGQVRPREMVVNWLHGVARQAALHARRTSCRRKDRQVMDMPEPKSAPDNGLHELQGLLDEELSHLPEKYRVVLLLCDIEGKTRKEASRQLNVPEGTVAGRIARARAMLATRFARRGLTLSTAALEVLLSQANASAGIPTALVSSTIKAVSLLTAGQTANAITANVAVLTQGVMKAMLIAKLKIAAMFLLFVSFAAAGGGLLIYGSPVVDRAATSLVGQDNGQANSSNQTTDGDAAARAKRLLLDPRLGKIEVEKEYLQEEIQQQKDMLNTFEKQLADLEKTLKDGERRREELLRVRISVIEELKKLEQKLEVVGASKRNVEQELKEAPARQAKADAEKRMAIAAKKSALEIANHQVLIAKAKRDAAQAALVTAKANYDRLRFESKTKVIDAKEVLRDYEFKLLALKGTVEEAESRVKIAEAEMAIESARQGQARVEFEELERLHDPAAGQAPAKSATPPALLQTQLKAAENGHQAAINVVTEKRKDGDMSTQLTDVYNWSVRWLHAQSDLSPSKHERVAAFSDHFQRMKELKEIVGKLVPAPSAVETAAALWYVTEAELWLLKEKAK